MTELDQNLNLQISSKEDEAPMQLTESEIDRVVQDLQDESQLQEVGAPEDEQQQQEGEEGEFVEQFVHFFGVVEFRKFKKFHF